MQDLPYKSGKISFDLNWIGLNKPAPELQDLLEENTTYSNINKYMVQIAKLGFTANYPWAFTGQTPTLTCRFLTT